MIKMPKEGKYKNYIRKIIPPFMVYANLKSILVPEECEKQNPDESYTSKYQKLPAELAIN